MTNKLELKNATSPIRCVACHKLFFYASGLTGLIHILCHRCKFLNVLDNGKSIQPQIPKSNNQITHIKPPGLSEIMAIMEERWNMKWAEMAYKKSQMATGLRFEIFRRDGFRCQYCGRAACDGAILEIDHKIPKSKGGNNETNNLITSCWECNNGKSNKIINIFPGS